MHAAMRADARRAVGCAAARKRCGMKRVDVACCFRPQADVHALGAGTRSQMRAYRKRTGLRLRRTSAALRGRAVIRLPA